MDPLPAGASRAPTKRSADVYGGIEAGGTKFRCAVGRGPDELEECAPIQTRSPEETLAEVVRFLRPHRARLSAVGLGCFGPVDLDRSSATHGHITTTPKPGWAHTDVVGILRRELGVVPIGFDTDVAAAALGEQRWGAARGLEDFVYVTVGTGIGGAVVARGEVVQGLVHPEIGHLRVPRVPGDDFAGVCPFHGDCLEGLASGPALRARTGRDPATLARDDPAWELEARTLAAGLVNLILTTSPRRIVVGGGVLEQTWLLARVRVHVLDLLQGYVGAPELGAAGIERFLVPPGLGARSGVLGALLLGERALRETRPGAATPPTRS